MTFLPLMIAACSLAVCGAGEKQSSPLMIQISTDTAAARKENTDHSLNYINAGNYLISRYAQQHHDWKTAQNSMRAIVESGITQDEILRRAMVLSMGAGDSKTALYIANKIIQQNPGQNVAIAQLFVITEAVMNKDYQKAAQLVQTTPQDSTSRFVSPYLYSWTQAASGKLDIGGLNENTLQLYHAILISDFLKDYSGINDMLGRAASVEDIHSEELLRIADLYAHIGEKEKAMAAYDRAASLSPEDQTIIEHKTALEKGLNEPLFPPVKTIQEGLGRAFNDIATALYQDFNDESARIFAHLALTIHPDPADTYLLLAHISGRHEQYDEAIGYYKNLPKKHKHYFDAQYKIADLLIQKKNENEAILILENMVKATGDVEAQIKIGDLHRSADRFGSALEAYNKAAAMLPKDGLQEYWHLHYFRGMVQEQIGNWDAAEKDLKTALEFQPDQPYILNYLGYAWADRGINLNKAQEMIARAVELRPDDGYIMDSLGWVKFKAKDYARATPILEKAVALLPYDTTINDHLGDSYWKVGRHREARFQWERAKNHSKEPADIQKLSEKIENGLHDMPSVAQARE